MTLSYSYANICLVLERATKLYKICASGSAVEHLLAKEGVAGSLPVSRSFFLQRKHTKSMLSFFLSNQKYVYNCRHISYVLLRSFPPSIKIRTYDYIIHPYYLLYYSPSKAFNFASFSSFVISFISYCFSIFLMATDVLH